MLQPWTHAWAKTAISPELKPISAISAPSNDTQMQKASHWIYFWYHWLSIKIAWLKTTDLFQNSLIWKTGHWTVFRTIRWLILIFNQFFTKINGTSFLTLGELLDVVQCVLKTRLIWNKAALFSTSYWICVCALCVCTYSMYGVFVCVRVCACVCE